MGDNNNQNSGDSNAGQQESASSAPQQSTQERLVAHFMANKIDSAMWATRILTIFFALGYLIPIFG